MFRNLRVRKPIERSVPEPGALALDRLAQDSTTPLNLRQVNALPANARTRVYRALLPPALLTRFGIDPIGWKGADGEPRIQLAIASDSGGVSLAARNSTDSDDDFLRIELVDNAFNSIDLRLLLLNDPDSPRFRTDIDAAGRPTLFGTARRNLTEEARAAQSGLAPAQIRKSLGASRSVLDHLEAFLLALGQRAYFLEPLTYASAWVFERRGFAYVRGHKLMDDIHKEFQPGGRLHQTLDGSTPFRRPDQWRTVTGRAWAIHDGILAAIDAEWDGLRMVKQIGRHAGVETFPNAVY
ncbi:MAG TPA: hypothetical protein VJG32_16295 [Anaerolineae bacterium]|nr:hypothetical protein [Anaerolineae bacterium]